MQHVGVQELVRINSDKENITKARSRNTKKNASKFDHSVTTFLQRDLNSHHSAAFNVLLRHQINNVVTTYGANISSLLGIDKYALSFSDVCVTNTAPTLSQCFTYGLSHMFNVTAAITLSVMPLDTQKQCSPTVIARVRTVIARVPLKTGNNLLSDHAFQDMDPQTIDVPTGYYVSAGKRRTVPAVRTARFDTPILLLKKHMFHLQIRSSHNTRIFRSSSTLNMSIDRVPKRISSVGMIYVKIPFQARNINISLLLLGFGVSAKRFVELIRIFAGKDYDAAVFRQFEITILHRTYNKAKTKEDAIMLISKLYNKNRLSTGINILDNEILPSCRADSFASNSVHASLKVMMLVKTTVMLIRFSDGQVPATNRDAYQNSKIVSSAELVGQLFRLLFINHLKTSSQLLRRALTTHEKKLLKENTKRKRHDMVDVDADTLHAEAAAVGSIDIVKMYGESRLTARILSAISNGSWSTKRKGVSISLTGTNTDAVIGQLRRISSSLSATDGAHTNPRNVQNDQYGYICAANSASGDSTGLVYELALTASISPCVINKQAFTELVEMLMSEYLVALLPDPSAVIRPDDVYLSNAFGNITHVIRADDVMAFVHEYRTARRTGNLPAYSFLEYSDITRTLRILHQGGLLVRPLVVFENMPMMRADMTFDDALMAGVIEYMTPAEEQTLCAVLVCIDDLSKLKPRVAAKITHMEFLQTAFLGVFASSIPFVTSIQGPRVAYLTAQLKQVMTMEMSRQRRGNIGGNMLWHTHRNLVTTKTARQRSTDVAKMTPCVLALIAVPDCQEDAIVIKKEFIERGGMATSSSRVYISDCGTPSSIFSEKFEAPNLVLSKKLAKYSHLVNGLPTVGTQINAKDVVIGKTRSISRSTGSTLEQKSIMISRRDISTVCKSTEPGKVTSSHLHTIPTGQRAVVEITTPRHLVIGDKVTTFHAQKSVVGRIIPGCDLPFSCQTGVSPDLLASPLCMTSRMTMASLLEALLGKAVCLSGDLEVGVDQQQYNVDNLLKKHEAEVILRQHGFSGTGKEAYICGKTGKMLEATILTGIVSYARLFPPCSTQTPRAFDRPDRCTDSAGQWWQIQRWWSPDWRDGMQRPRCVWGSQDTSEPDAREFGWLHRLHLQRV